MEKSSKEKDFFFKKKNTKLKIYIFHFFQFFSTFIVCLFFLIDMHACRPSSFLRSLFFFLSLSLSIILLVFYISFSRSFFLSFLYSHVLISFRSSQSRVILLRPLFFFAFFFSFHLYLFLFLLLLSLKILENFDNS